MKKENALMKLGRTLSEYLKGTPAPKKSDRRNQSAHNRNHNNKQFKPRRRRYEEYREEQKAQNLNVARSQITNSDGTIITVDVYSHQSAHTKRSYRKSERR